MPLTNRVDLINEANITLQKIDQSIDINKHTFIEDLSDTNIMKTIAYLEFSPKSLPLFRLHPFKEAIDCDFDIDSLIKLDDAALSNLINASYTSTESLFPLLSIDSSSCISEELNFHLYFT